MDRTNGDRRASVQPAPRRTYPVRFPIGFPIRFPVRIPDRFPIQFPIRFPEPNAPTAMSAQVKWYAGEPAECATSFLSLPTLMREGVWSMTASTWKLPGWADVVGLYHRAPQAHVFAVELSAVALIATTAAVMIAVGSIRHRKTKAALQDRAAYDLLPTNSFDPTAEDIHRFARIVQRTRLAASGWTPRNAAAVRIRMRTVEHGRLAYRVEGSRRAGATLGQQAFAGVELRAVIDHFNNTGNTLAIVDAPPNGAADRRDGEERP